MAQEYTRALLKVAVVQICHGIGWDSMQSTAGEVLVDVFHRYLTQFSKQIHMCSELTGRTEATLNDVTLASCNMGINFTDLVEYIRFVEAVPFPQAIPKYPVYKESHLNFLKPGSHEVLRRPVHVHEHLPAMYPEMEHKDGSNSGLKGETSHVTSTVVSPKAGTLKCQGDTHCSGNQNKRHLEVEDEGMPLREISSVMMTTSGFLSTSREGKPPESRPMDFDSVCPLPEVLTRVKGKKIKSKIKEVGKIINKKDKENKEGSENNEGSDLKEAKSQHDDSQILKQEVALKKTKKVCSLKGEPSGTSTKKTQSKRKLTKTKCEDLSPEVALKKRKLSAVAGDLSKFAAPNKGAFGSKVEKILCEPDKQKLNIFKRISKVKDDKSKEIPIQPCSREDERGPVCDKAEADDGFKVLRLAKIDDTIEGVIKLGSRDSVVVHADHSKITKTQTLKAPTLKDLKTVSPKRKRKCKVKTPKKKISSETTNVEDELSESLDNQENSCSAPSLPVPTDAHSSLASLFSNPLIPRFHPSPHKESRLPYLVHNTQHPAMPNLPMPPAFFTLPNPDVVVEKPICLSTNTERSVEEEEERATKKDRKSKKLKRKKRRNSAKRRKLAKKGNEKGKKTDQLAEQGQSEAPTLNVALKAPELSCVLQSTNKIVGRPRKKKPKSETSKTVKTHENKETLVGNISLLDNSQVGSSSVSDLPSPSATENIPLHSQNIDISTKPARSVKRQRTPVDACKVKKTKATTKLSKCPLSKEPLKSPEETKAAAYCFEEGGIKIWICPNCKGRDDGSLMIECDGCEAWYHCMCVGIQVPPRDTDDWFCSNCVLKMQTKVSANKRKKRNVNLTSITVAKLFES